ncbi:MAG: MATE family efflux transporter [Flavobacteriia bacterium]|nr:MAG: MATE family efflux transporter [Flavobacteriia bacterium]
MTTSHSDISVKAIARLAVPALFAGIAEPLLSIVDTAFVGHIPQFPKESLAAVGLVGVFLSMLIWILGQTRSAISTIVSQYLGASKLKQIEILPAQTVYTVVALAVLIIIITYPLAPYIFKLYNADNHILDFSIIYYRIRVFGLPFTLFTFAVFGVFRGLQNTFYPMIIALAGALLNIVLDYVLIYGIEGLMQPMYLRGAAYASVIAQISMAVMATIYLYKKTDIRLRLKLPFHPEMRTLSVMVLNLFVRTIALNVALYLGSSFATKYGNDSIAAYTIAINIWFFFAFFIDGLSSAGNILSGKLYGARAYSDLKALANKLMVWSIVLGVVLALISGMFYYAIGRIFIKDQQVLQTFYGIFWIVLAMQPLNSIAFIFDGIFKGLGYMKYLRNVLLIATFVGFVPVILFSDDQGWGLTGIWLAFVVWILLRGALLVVKFYNLPLVKQQATVEGL